MIATIERRYSLDEYRAISEKAEERSEYRDGEIVPMPGGSLNHSRIGGNTFAFLKFLLRDTKFEPINSDLRLWIPAHRRGVYPDVMVFAGEPELNSDRRLRHEKSSRSITGLPFHPIDERSLDHFVAFADDSIIFPLREQVVRRKLHLE